MDRSISVVIPTLNESSSITATVQSGFAAGASEVVVADGGSRDDTCRIAEAAEAQVVVCDPGRGQQLNAGAKQANGDVLFFLHADCRIDRDALQQIDTALADPKVLGGAFRQRIEADGFLYRLLERGNAFRAARLKLPYGDQGIFIRRSTFEQLGGFADVPIMEDVVLMRRLRRLSRPVLLPGPLYVSARRWKKQGIVRQTARNWLLLWAFTLGVSPQRLARFYPRHDMKRQASDSSSH